MNFSVVWSKKKNQLKCKIIRALKRKTSPTIEEVEMAVQELKKYKAPGTDHIPAEIFMCDGNELLKHLHSIIREICLKEKMPTDWNYNLYNLSHA
jgi:hypothetical protein